MWCWRAEFTQVRSISNLRVMISHAQAVLGWVVGGKVGHFTVCAANLQSHANSVIRNADRSTGTQHPRIRFVSRANISKYNPLNTILITARSLALPDLICPRDFVLNYCSITVYQIVSFVSAASIARHRNLSRA